MQITNEHSSFFHDFVEIDPNSVSDFIYKSKKCEIKETSIRKNKKDKYVRICFTFKKKDVKSHDYFIFHDIDLHDLYLCDAKDIDAILLRRCFKESTTINLNVIQKISLFKSSNMNEILKTIEGLL